jgi:hypothetical protein
MHRNSHLVQPSERARADPADDNGINLLIIKRLHRVACAMRVTLVPVADRRNTICFRVENDKYRRRAKVIIHCAIDPIVLLDWKTDFHVMLLRSMIYTTFIQLR